MFGKMFSKLTGKKEDKPVTESTPDDWNRADIKEPVAEGDVDGPPSIHFQNLDKKVDVAPGTTILDAAVQAGLDLNHYCGGMASCGSCMVTVISGKVSEMDDMEEATLDVVMEDDRDRLSCQTRILGPVVVTMPPQD